LTVSSQSRDLEALVGQKYRHGFVTDIDADTVPPGLDEDVIRLISRKKGEPSSCSSGVSSRIATG
jgi:Fe-S cluster assembly protein SufB